MTEGTLYSVLASADSSSLGSCGSSQSTHDKITTKSSPPSNVQKPKQKRDALVAEPHQPEARQASGNMLGLPGREVIDPPYMINNAAGSLSNKTIDTRIRHSNGLVEYDTHNLYGAMMSEASRKAMLSRRPTLRPMISKSSRTT